MKNLLKTFKEYIFSLRKFILIAFLIFVFSALSGYFFAQNSFFEKELILGELRQMFEPVLALSPFGLFLFILLNNGLTAFFAVVLGIIFGVFPFLILFSNGAIIGILAYFIRAELSWEAFFIGIIPHGMIEIPIIILACAVGLKLGKVFFEKVFNKKGSLKEELNFALNFFLKFLFPFLILAAAIEVFITSQLL